jgi:hypothetical protein
VPVPVATSDPISTGNWYHVVGTFDGSNARIYLDGEASDFSLAKTGTIDGEVIIGVSDSGDHAIYTVSVNTGAGSGTLRLDIPDSANIDDSAGNSLAE